MLQIGNRRTKFQNKTGFTFLELVFVVLIMSVLTGISVPLFRKTYSNMQLVQSCSDLSGALNFARQNAILNRNEYRLVLNTDDSSFWIEYKALEADKPVFKKIEGKFGKIYYLPKNLKITADKNILTFYPNGRSDIITIVITNNLKSYTFSTEGTAGYAKIR